MDKDKLYKILYILASVGLTLAVLVMSSCTVIGDGDRTLALKVFEHGEAGCIYIQGSGGAGSAIPGVPIIGGYGQGSLTAAHSNTLGAKLHCGPDGAWIE